MKRPEMIIFDYGHTLLYEPDWDADRGNRELLKYIIKNPNNCSLTDIEKEVGIVFGEIAKVRRDYNFDVPCRTGQHLVYDHLGITFSLTPLERETVFWTAATPGAIAPNADILIDYLNRQNIRTAVISNNGWSGEALKERFDRLLPNNRFEFILSSCDYMVRKPDKRIFEIALNKAELRAEQVWYCGDNIYADVQGSYHAGMYPVFYQGNFPKEDRRETNCDEHIIDFQYLKINDWCQLIKCLDSLS